MAKKNDPMTLTLPDIGEGGHIVPGKNTIKAVAELLSARGMVTLSLRPLPNDDSNLVLTLALREVSLHGNSVDDIRGGMGVWTIIEGRTKEGESFTAAVEWYLSDVGKTEVADEFPMLSKDQVKVMAPFLSSVFNYTNELERAARESHKGLGLKESTRTLLIEALKAGGKPAGALEGSKDKPGLKIRLRSSED